MLSARRLRGGAIIAAALTFAACGSDKVAGPTTANNEQIIADMTSAYSHADPDNQGMRKAMLSFAISALAAGAPVSSGNVTIDGARYPFSFTSLSLELNSGGEIVSSVTIVTGWRHSNGDSLVVLVYAPDGTEVFPLRGTPAVGAAQLRAPGSLGLAEVARMVRDGKVSKEVVSGSGSFNLQSIMFSVGDDLWGADTASGAVQSGSIASTETAGECAMAGLNALLGGGINIDSCVFLKSSIAASSDLVGIDSSETEGRSITVPAQAVTGVKVVAHPIER